MQEENNGFLRNGCRSFTSLPLFSKEKHESRGAACLRLAWKRALSFLCHQRTFFPMEHTCWIRQPQHHLTPRPLQGFLSFELDNLGSTEESFFNFLSCKWMCRLCIATAFYANPCWSWPVLWFSFLFFFSNMHFQNNKNKSNQIKGLKKCCSVVEHLPRMYKALGS